MNTKLLMFLILHFIGAIIVIIIYCLDGTMKDASEHGDGIRTATPSDIILQTLALWEIHLFIDIITIISGAINLCFKKWSARKK
jgi:NADH:ubiquinone oxidoreductase subunit 6 (subunit J)